MLTVGSLFSGIGGLDLGLERAGMQIKWQCEIDDYATQVLQKHWPDVSRFRDVRTVGAHNLVPVDLICGGFPCQDISKAGNGAGLDGAHSGLWAEYVRIIGELRPRFVLVENVPALLKRGFGRVLGNLAALRYDAEWGVLSACAVGAPHTRERLFLLAYADGEHDVYGRRRTATIFGRRPQAPEVCRSEYWHTQSEPSGVANGVPAQLDRLKGLGNAVVPQVAEWIGRQIIAAA
jgi:DNA (cytosine-5)-methyltransferase 1